MPDSSALTLFPVLPQYGLIRYNPREDRSEGKSVRFVFETSTEAKYTLNVILFNNEAYLMGQSAKTWPVNQEK